MKARLVGVVCAGMAVALLASVSSAALMTMAVEGHPGDPGYIDATHVKVAPGNTVTLDVYATFSGTNGINSDDGVYSVFGSLKTGISALGGAQGNLSFTPAAVVAAALNQPGGAQSGAIKDLDGDGDLDVGQTAAGSQLGTDWILLFTGNAATLAAAGDGDRLLVGTLTFTAFNSDIVGSETDATWVYRNKTGLGGTIQAFKIDGVNKTLAGNSSDLGVSSANILIVPEPATMAILALGGLGVLLRRKKA